MHIKQEQSKLLSTSKVVSTAFHTKTYDRMKKIGVVLMNLGGPNNEEAVQPFLYNLFMDDDNIKIPIKGGVNR